ncbi:MAG TPA: acyltransferase [Longimicrobium sp.]|jgi:acetyltransferase-like isoleucine patch superfamily enzyme|uniref:acyltransferase n=1 Tax=Longimicrobium sp. TaxID=2029185 RepID=UPI002ED9A7D5
MPRYPLKKLDPAAEATALYQEWLDDIRTALERGDDRWELCRRTLTGLFYPGLRDVDPCTLPLTPRVALAQMDARNVTLEPEYYGEVDTEKFNQCKPLLWMWQMFDRSPLGGNVHLGVQFRRTLAPFLFKRVGRNFKCFHNVEFSYGYNMEVGDDVVVHRNVLLDDRGGIVLGNGVSISDYANIYSHTHSIVDQVDVSNLKTVIDDGVRITYHATVLAGTHVGANAMVGAMAVATKDVRPYHVNVGIPAKSVRVKPNAPPEAYKLTLRREDGAEVPAGGGAGEG